MNGKIWYIQKEFFQKISDNEEIKNINIPVYVNVPENAKMPYIGITYIGFSEDSSLKSNRNQFKIDMTIFDNAKSIKKISQASYILEKILNLDYMNEKSQVFFVSIEHIETTFKNDPRIGFMSASIQYSGIIEF